MAKATDNLSVKSVIDHLTAKQAEYAAQMRTNDVKKQTEAGRKANSAQNDINNLTRLEKRLSAGFYA